MDNHTLDCCHSFFVGKHIRDDENNVVTVHSYLVNKSSKSSYLKDLLRKMSINEVYSLIDKSTWSKANGVTKTFLIDRLDMLVMKNDIADISRKMDNISDKFNILIDVLTLRDAK